MGSLGSNFGQGFSSPAFSRQTAQSAREIPESVSVDGLNGDSLPLPPPGIQVANGGTQPPIPFDALFRSDLNLNATQVARLLRHLLQLPPEILELLALLSQLEPGNSSQILRKLSQDRGNVPLNDLQAFLMERLDSSQGKLIKLIQSHPGESGSSLKNLLRLREELAEHAGTSGTEAVKTLITLYLPTLPLRDLQEFRLRFLNPNLPLEKQLQDDPTEADGTHGGNGENSGDAANANDGARWLVTIQTHMWGEFRIVLVIHNEHGKLQALSAHIGHEAQAFPILPKIRSQLTHALETDRLPEPILTFIPRQSKAGASSNKTPAIDPGASGSSATPAAQVQAGNAPATAPAIGIHWAYRIIRLILDLDNQALSESQHKADGL